MPPYRAGKSAPLRDVAKSFRLTAETAHYLQQLKEMHGVSESSIVEIALRREARREGIATYRDPYTAKNLTDEQVLGSNFDGPTRPQFPKR